MKFIYDKARGEVAPKPEATSNVTELLPLPPHLCLREPLEEMRAEVCAIMSGQVYHRIVEDQVPDDFCLVHGYEHMYSEPGNPVPHCSVCEREQAPMTYLLPRDGADYELWLLVATKNALFAVCEDPELSDARKVLDSIEDAIRRNHVGA